MDVISTRYFGSGCQNLFESIPKRIIGVGCQIQWGWNGHFRCCEADCQVLKTLMRNRNNTVEALFWYKPEEMFKVLSEWSSISFFCLKQQQHTVQSEKLRSSISIVKVIEENTELPQHAQARSRLGIDRTSSLSETPHRNIQSYSSKICEADA